MTHCEILKKAVEKAEDNHFDFLLWYSNEFLVPIPHLRFEECMDWLLDHATSFGKLVIFSHEFAQAFWGKDLVSRSTCLTELEFKDWIKKSCPKGEVNNTWKNVAKLSRWKLHLQQMVLLEDPIQYLERFLNDS